MTLRFKCDREDRAAKTRLQLFLPFTRLSNSRSRRSTNTGAATTLALSARWRYPHHAVITWAWREPPSATNLVIFPHSLLSIRPLLQAAGGMFSAGALYPLEVIKTNLQAHTKQSTGRPSPSQTEEAEEDGGGDRQTTSPGGEGRRAGGEEEEEEGLLLTRRSKQQERQLDSPPSVASVAKDIYSREGIAGLYRGVAIFV